VNQEQELSEFAYYYPEPYWRGVEGEALKNLLLFFDGIAILLPRYMAGRESMADPVLAGPLKDLGLLRVLEPEVFVDQIVTEQLLAAMTELITGGAFDDLNRGGYYAELSRSRMGWEADIELSKMIIEELQARDLARPSEDGVSIPLHPVVRTVFLVLLAQLARTAGRRSGLGLHPTMSNQDVVESLMHTLALPASPSVGHVVAFDLQAVGLNLETVPLDEVLAFRREHGDPYRAYARNVRQYVAELALLDSEQRRSLLLDRREELADLSNDLQKTARRAWRRPLASFSLGAAGAAWTVASQHDALGAALALAGVVVGLTSDKPQASAYSYIFDARRTLSGRNSALILGFS
jgi:hypothetical protein